MVFQVDFQDFSHLTGCEYYPEFYETALSETRIRIHQRTLYVFVCAEIAPLHPKLKIKTTRARILSLNEQAIMAQYFMF